MIIFYLIVFRKKFHNLKHRKEIENKLNNLSFTYGYSEKKFLLLNDLLKVSLREGVIVECGVGVGFTLSILSNISTKKIYAFDSFEGFPEDLSVKEDKNLFKVLKYSKWNYKLMTIDLVKKNLLKN